MLLLIINFINFEKVNKLIKTFINLFINLLTMKLMILVNKLNVEELINVVINLLTLFEPMVNNLSIIINFIEN